MFARSRERSSLMSGQSAHWYWEVCIQLWVVLRVAPWRPGTSPDAACGADQSRSPWPARAGGSPCTYRRSAWRSGSPSRLFDPS